MCTRIFASMAFFVFTKLLSRKGYFPVCPGGWNGWALYHKTGFISIFIFIYIFKLVDLSQQRIKIMYLFYGKKFLWKENCANLPRIHKVEFPRKIEFYIPRESKFPHKNSFKDSF